MFLSSSTNLKVSLVESCQILFVAGTKRSCFLSLETQTVLVPPLIPWVALGQQAALHTLSAKLSLSPSPLHGCRQYEGENKDMGKSLGPHVM